MRAKVIKALYGRMKKYTHKARRAEGEIGTLRAKAKTPTDRAEFYGELNKLSDALEKKTGFKSNPRVIINKKGSPTKVMGAGDYVRQVGKEAKLRHRAADKKDAYVRVMRRKRDNIAKGLSRRGIKYDWSPIQKIERSGWGAARATRPVEKAQNVERRRKAMRLVK